MSVFEVVAAVVLVVFTVRLNVLPTKYIILLSVVLILLSGLIIYLQFTKFHWIGKAVALILTFAFIICTIYLIKTKDALESISNTTETDVVAVYVLKDDPANTIQDAKDYTFGLNSVLDRTNTDLTVQEINESVGKEIDTIEYDDLMNMIDDLYAGQNGAIVMNESYTESVMEAYPVFADETKIIYEKSFESDVVTTAEKNTASECFTIYLSGNDQSGALTKTGRSDVNILMVVNPTTKQILLINTPRDYYVPVDSLKSGVGMDKLTHAGQFGVEASMKTLSNLYDGWNVDYFVKLNFTGVEGIVDALGGVTVDSEVAFTTLADEDGVEYNIVKGPNKLTGKSALLFCRERYAVAGGDGQRGKDQMALVQAIIDKVASPSILTNYTGLMDSVSSLFQTNLGDDEIGNLVKVTMDSSEGWNMQSYNVEGNGSDGSSHFFGYSSMYVMIPDQDTVNTAVELMKKTADGEVFDVNDYVNSR